MYRNPASILDPAALDMGMGSTNGTVNSKSSVVPSNYGPRLRYNHMSIMSHLPNGSIAAAWQVGPAQSSSIKLTVMPCPAGGDKEAAGRRRCDALDAVLGLREALQQPCTPSKAGMTSK